MKNLIIVESPTKAKTISGYLADNFQVLSSKGHIRDLKIAGPGGLGIDIENNFEPLYTLITKSRKIVTDLKKAAKGAKVYLASDPDREGESIAWHLAEVLELDKTESIRIVFNEITKSAVQKALSEPRQIDMKLVDSQESRRMVDRIIGFKLSKLARQKIGGKSAGRVQTVVLKLIVLREKEIKAFVPETYFDLKLVGKGFEAPYISVKKHEVTKEIKEKVEREATPLYLVKDIQENETKTYPKPAHTTSSFQQEVANKLGWSAKKAMQVAQSLYEGVETDTGLTGLITYMRTDSTRVSVAFIQEAKDYIENTYGSTYLGVYPVKKNQAAAQDAHEAIRPVSVYNTPQAMASFLTPEQLKIYTLIYNRALAANLAAAVFKNKTVTIAKNGHLFQAHESVCEFKGHRILDEKIEDKVLPIFKIGQEIDAKLVSEEKQTQPPARYNEGSLIKKMEELGIGRPSTYAQIIETLKSRVYINVEKRQFIPTDLAFDLVSSFDEYFVKLMDPAYTSKMEKELDEIAHADINKVEFLTKFYREFMETLTNAEAKMPSKKFAQILEEPCPKCEKPLILRKSVYGFFKGCTGFPKCRYIEKAESDQNSADV